MIDDDETKRLVDFPWPCERRDAHGPHLLDEVETVEVGRFGDGGLRLLQRPRECPGVPAHPSTMAGGSWR